MGLRINTNVQSLEAQRHVGQTRESMQNTELKMASGSRINSAADDAAGLSIAEKLRAKVRSLNQAIRNGADGISMIQTAEGAMNEISNILIRFRELSIQAASDTVGDTERGYINREVQQLKSEVGRIAGATEFNGTKLLASEPAIKEIQIGTENNPENDRFYYDVLRSNMTPERLKIASLDVASKWNAQQSLDVVDNSIRIVSSTRAQLGALQNRIVSGLNYMRQHVENIAESRSRIMDADMAEVSSDDIKQRILEQAGISVLSQANQTGSMALKLLG